MITILSSDYQSIASLPCFSGQVNILEIPGGMSHKCFKVTCCATSYFVKKLNPNTARAEINYSKAIHAAESSKQFTPRLIYADDTWLVSQFIQGRLLAESSAHHNDKLCTCLSLIAKLHLYPVPQEYSLPCLDIRTSIEKLASESKSKLSPYMATIENITDFLCGSINLLINNSDSKIVMCHGDINFSNILIDNNNSPWLIDFECAHLAPQEFDVAMFIAVNNIATSEVQLVKNTYNRLADQSLNELLLCYYRLYSYLINGLWYLNRISDYEDKDQGKINNFAQLSQQQWSSFDQLADNKRFDLPSLSTYFI